ncbi:MAG: hypothetical protein ACTSU5_18375, partial [Promethearchaeota archaeon]
MADDEDREYYIETWGFDPYAERLPLEGGGAGDYRYEAWFDLKNDPELHAAGVVIGSRVDWRRGNVKNYIVLKRGGSEASVECTHTVVYTGPPGDAMTLATDEGLLHATDAQEDELLEEYPPVELPPEEHFVALRSYVAALASVGIHVLFTAVTLGPGLDSRQYPFGFNDAMQSQIRDAVGEISPELLDNWSQGTLCELLLESPPSWVADRWEILEDKWGITGLAARKVRLFELLCERDFFGLGGIKAKIAIKTPVSMEVLEILAADGDAEVRRKLANRNDLPEAAMETLAKDADVVVRRKLANRKDLPEAAMETLAKDGDVEVRNGLADRYKLPDAALETLARDEDVEVRRKLAHRYKLPDAALETLSADADMVVR